MYGGLSTAIFSSQMETLRALEGAMIVSGMVFIGLALVNLIHKLANLFTPVVLGTYLLLLVFQLSGSFINGMLGVGYRKDGIDIPITVFSLALVLLTFYLSRHPNRIISQYSILFSLGAGWFFYLLGFMKPVSHQLDQFVKAPELLAFGTPVFDLGMSITAVFVTFLLLTNMAASIQLVDKVTHNKEEKRENVRAVYKRAGFVAGINHILTGCFSAVGSVPISGAAGFIATTKNARLMPFLIGSDVGYCSKFLAAYHVVLLPSIPVGYSVMFVVFANMIGIAFSEFDEEREKERVRFVIGLALLSGVGVMFIPTAAFAGVPAIITSIISNGLIVGSIVAIILDQWTRRTGVKDKGLGKKQDQ